MTKNGIVVAQTGVNVQRAADYQKLLDSDFPTMNIHQIIDIDTTVNTPAAYTNVFSKIYNHGLGYMPVFEWFVDHTTYDAWHSIGFDNYGLRADEQNFYVVSSFPSLTYVPVKGRLVIYSRDIKEKFIAPKNITRPSSGANSRFGVKATLPNKRMGSSEYSDFSINTNAKAFLIHSSDIYYVDATNNYTVTINHGLGYMPSYLVYYLRDKDFTTNPPTGLNNVTIEQFEQYRTQGDSQKLLLFGVQSTLIGSFIVILFKDPVGLDNV